MRHLMSTQPKVTMPQDWNDHSGWDHYHRDQLARDAVRDNHTDVGSIPVEQLPRIMADLKSRGGTSAWVPGCGLSPLPKLLVFLGLEVVATDVSSSAIAFQRSDRNDVTRFVRTWATTAEHGSLSAEVHDFREEFRQDAFDLIINVKAFQGFPLEDMRRIAGVHARALRAGRRAFFDTMNVQGERRNDLEQALEEGGFVVPFARLDRWDRHTLNETGIPHLFILGRPMIPRKGEYATDQARWERDMARLKEITTQYQSRAQVEREAERVRIGSASRVATVIYSTG
jgi:hypothetical protein